MESRPSYLRRWWLALAVGAVVLLLVGAKLSVRSVATGQPLLPGVAGAPVLGPAPTASPTAGPPRVRLRVSVTDPAGQPVPAALVEVRDRFNAVVASQETGVQGDALPIVPLGSGYVVTVRKQGYQPGRVEAIDASQATPPPTPTRSPDLAQPTRVFSIFGGPAVRVQLQAAPLAPGAPVAAAARLIAGHAQARLSLIDATSNLLLKHSEPLGQNRPTLMAAARDASRIFATWSGGTELFVISPADLSVERQLTLGPGGITSLAVSPSGGRVWVAAITPDVSDSSTLYELDPAAQQVLRQIPVNQVVSGMRFAPDGATLYVPNRSATTLLVIDPGAGTVMRAMRLPQAPTDLAVAQGGGSLFITNLSADRLVELNAVTGDPVRSIDVGAGSSAVVLHPDGKRAFVVNQLLGYVQIIDLAAGQVVDAVPVGTAPQGAVLTRDGNGLYVANVRSGSISLIDLDKRAVTETLSIGGQPSSLLMLAPGA